MINGLITDIINEMNLQDTTYKEDKVQMNFFDTRAISFDQTFTGVAGPTELDVINENGVKPEQDKTKLPNKGFAIVEWGGKIPVTFLMTQWLKTSQSLSGADSSVKREWMQFADNSRYLLEGAQMNITQEMIKLWILGLDPVTTVFGPGSPTPKGKPLFSQTHPVRNGTQTFANVAPTNIVLTNANLQVAIDILKVGVRNENGYYVLAPQVYKLFVSKRNAVTARQILNTAGSQAGIYSGVAANANQKNQFSFNGNMIEIVELTWLGQRDKNGVLLGTDDYWFLSNPPQQQISRGFRIIDLYQPTMKNYINNETDAYVTDIRLGFAVDHYGAESSIFGSKGDNTASNA